MLSLLDQGRSPETLLSLTLPCSSRPASSIRETPNLASLEITVSRVYVCCMRVGVCDYLKEMLTYRSCFLQTNTENRF